MGHMIPITKLCKKKIKFSLEVIPQRITNGVCVGFPQSDSVCVKLLITQSEIHVRLMERNCITPLKVNFNPLMGKYCSPNG